MFKYTRLGKAMRATSDDAAARPYLRHPDDQGHQRGMADRPACSPASPACARDGPRHVRQSNTGGSFLLLIVAAAVFGSVGEPYGAMVGALVIGIVERARGHLQPGAQGRRRVRDPGPRAAAAA